MKIGELSKQTGVSRDTIRFYEGKEMLTNITRPFEWNDYKDYSEENVKRIQIIKYLQRFSFKLKEIKELLDQKDANPNKCIDKSKIFRSKLQIIEKEIDELKKTRDALLEIIND
ncbi:MerR family transcriptional regulator [Aquimarina sp. MMG016]|uniref:MerR family transcriptional regulator n=1 Tax=Aquimarina sp. MMG016 TaxID=2822690 RepID=UPI001B3A0558|nr:MerR family transcriptional regulator [Aquimarina sp. MMG016]MBQ4820194.1 MerR family transcriptional regulator [Aquimarina sp. MMG016]